MRMIFGLMFVSAAWTAMAGVYRWTDSNGVVHFGDRPPSMEATELEVDGGAGKHIGGLRPGERAMLRDVEHETHERLRAREQSVRDQRNARERRARARARCHKLDLRIHQYRDRLRAGCTPSTCERYNRGLRRLKSRYSEQCS